MFKTSKLLNYTRPKLTKLLTGIEVTHIMVEHKDRLTRFGFNYIKNWMASRQCKIIIINKVETDKEDLMQRFYLFGDFLCSPSIWVTQKQKKN